MSCSSSKPFLARRRVFFIALLLASPAMALAQEAVDLGTVVVQEEASDPQTPSLDATAAATVIIPEQQADPTKTVPDLLEESAGVHVKRYGGLDDFSALSLRGSTSAQVQIYLDDVPLVSAQGDLVDLSLVPLAGIERIEVYRGGSPGMVPDSTAGGVVIMQTKARPEKRSLSVRNIGGSFTTYRGTVSAAEPFGKCSLLATYERFQSDGNFTYINNNGTTFNQADDRLVERQNNDFASNSLFMKFTAAPTGATSVAVTNTFFEKDQGIPGLGSRESTTARLQTWRDLAAVQADHDFPSVPGLALHGDLFFDFLNSQFSDPQGQIGLSRQENDDDTYRFGENVRAEYAWGAHQLLKGYVAGRTEFFLPMNRLATPPSGPHSHRNTVSTGAEDEIRLWGERVVFAPSARFVAVFNDLSNDDPSNPSAVLSTNRRTDLQLSAKAGLKVRMIGGLFFKANIYRGYRNPTFSELFGDRGTIVGNPTLRPEKTFNIDGGLAFHHAGDRLRTDVEAAYFRSLTDDLIQFVQTSQFTIQSRNMSRALIQGMEFSARVAWAERLSGWASYTFQEAKDASDLPATAGKYIPGRPKNELDAGIAWKEAWRPWFGTRLFGDVNVMSGNYIDTQNLVEVNRRTLLEAGATAAFGKAETLAFTFSVKNLLNEHIDDVVGYPLPGRSYWGTVEVKL